MILQLPAELGPVLLVLVPPTLAFRLAWRRGWWWLPALVLAGVLALVAEWRPLGLTVNPPVIALCCWLVAVAIGGLSLLASTALLWALSPLLLALPHSTGPPLSLWSFALAIVWLVAATAVNRALRRPFWLRALYLGVCGLGAASVLALQAYGLAVLLLAPVLDHDPNYGDDSFGANPFRRAAAQPILVTLLAGAIDWWSRCFAS